MITIKLLISTSQNALNYGAVLQSYAFAEYIKNMKIDYYMLNYYEKYNLYFGKINLGSARNLLSSLYVNFLNLIYFFQKKRQIDRFDSFLKDYIALTKVYKTIEELLLNPPKADIYITGGDQMFNCRSGVGVQGFLKFGSEKIKRYSYSTSMGIEEAPKQYLNEFIDSLNQYEKVSLREEKAKNYIDKYCNVKTQVNIDPVFLLDKNEWQSLIKDHPRIYKKKYILVYELLNHPLTNKLINKLKENNSFDVVVISADVRNKVKADKVIRDAGPKEFINLFANAEKIITTSFHGTCFSIIFEKEFYTLISNPKEVRINSLLHKFKLESRMMRKEITISNNGKIDFSVSKNIIKAECEKSHNYFLEILGKTYE